MRLKITMKSGRSYKTQKLKKYTVSCVDGKLNGINWESITDQQFDGVLITSLTLNDIEAIEVIR